MFARVLSALFVSLFLGPPPHAGDTVVGTDNFPDIQLKVTSPKEGWRTYSGCLCTVGVFADSPAIPRGGHQFLIGYDPGHYRFVEIDSKDAAAADNTIVLDSLTSGCGDLQCTYHLLRINGVLRNYSGDSSGPIELARFTLALTGNANLACQDLPIRFFWEDESSNRLVLRDTNQSLIAAKVEDFTEHDECNPLSDSLPTGFFPDFLSTVDTNRYLPAIRFVNAAVPAWCNDLERPGDINANGIALEEADLELLRRYMLFGNEVFDSLSLSARCQLDFQSDVNADGIPRQLSDLVLLANIYHARQVPIPTYATKLVHQDQFVTELRVDIKDNVTQVHLISPPAIDLCASRLEFRGRMKIIEIPDGYIEEYFYDGEYTRMLLVDLETGTPFPKECIVVLSGDGSLSEIELSSCSGKALEYTLNVVN